MTSFVRPFCWPCAHYIPNRQYNAPGEGPLTIGSCAAFPDGIPPEIATGRADYRLPYPGHHGVQFSPKPGLAEQGWTNSVVTEFLDRKVANASQE